MSPVIFFAPARESSLYNGSMPFIRTKIVSTVGPASAEASVLEELVKAGCDVLRVNFSHGTDEQHASLLANIRAVESKLGVPLCVIADLCGPKIRVRPLLGEELMLNVGDDLIIQRNPTTDDGGQGLRISTTLEEMIDEVAPGQAILLDDGKIRLEVASVSPPKEVTCRVIRGGLLRSGKGVNLPQTGLKLSALTEKDKRDAAWIAARDFDYVALSFVRTAGDLVELRDLLRNESSTAGIVAKIEKPQALNAIDAIIDVADGVMVARGDLGVEMDLPAVPVAQKQIARKCQAAGKPCIIATQMLETMTEAPGPTRAEVSDVANAVLDYTDAVMLSGETAMGRYPVEAVTMMNDIVSRMEDYRGRSIAPSQVVCDAAPTVAALGGAVRQIIDTISIAAICVYTATGTTARVMSKSRLDTPILALCPDPSAVRRMGLYYGVFPVLAGAPEHTRDVLALASEHLLRLDLVTPGDLIVVLSGRPIARPGATNTLVVHQV